MRISDWSSDVCSSDLAPVQQEGFAVGDPPEHVERAAGEREHADVQHLDDDQGVHRPSLLPLLAAVPARGDSAPRQFRPAVIPRGEFCGLSINGALSRSEEHTSELQSLMRISYAVFCLKTKTNRST